MSTLKVPPKVRLFMGIIYDENSEIISCLNSLEQKYGQIGFKSKIFPFDSTSYYSSEMGQNLSRKFIAFEELIKREQIVEVKHYSNDLEDAFSLDKKRTINIDPGYIAAEHVVLSTGKAYSHRPYLGEGVYADLTLVYKNNSFIFLDWTYPDYKDKNIQDIFIELRSNYLEDLKKEI